MKYYTVVLLVILISSQLTAEDKLLDKVVIDFNLDSLTVVNLGQGINSPKRDYSPFITPDFKEIYFNSDRDGSIKNLEGKNSHDIWKADIKYENEKLFFENVKNVVGLNTQYNEGSIYIASDGVYMTYCNTPNGLGDCDLFKLTNFQGKTIMMNIGPPINTRDFESFMSFSKDMKTIYFGSNRLDSKLSAMGSMQIDIFKAEKNEKNEWNEPKRLDFNTEGYEGFPFILYDDVTLVFASNKIQPNYGGFDLYMTRLDKKSGKWTKPQNLGNKINSKWNEMTPFVNHNGNMMFFSSDRKDFKEAQGDYDIYMVEFPIPIIEEETETK